MSRGGLQIHICILTEKYPPIVGGGESHLEALAQGLALAGHEVTVLTETPAQFSPRPPAVGLRFIEIPGLVSACQTGNMGEAIRSLRDAYTELTNADVTHICNKIPATLSGLLRGYIPGAVCLSTFETVIVGTRVFGLWSDYELEMEFSRNVAKLLDPAAVICGSDLYRDWLLAEGYSDSVIHVIHHGTDTNTFSPNAERRAEARQRYGWTDENKVVLVPSRIVPRKRIQDSINAFPIVLSSVPEARLILTEPSNRNDTEYVSQMKRLVSQNSLSEHVEWLTGVTLSEMPDLMRASDVAVLPADDDGFGIVLIEALASGVPVVTSDVPGHDEAITPEVGILCPPHDVNRLAAAVIESVQKPNSQRISAGHARVEELFTTDLMVSRHIDVYRLAMATS